MATDHIKMAHAVLSGGLDPDQLDAADFKQLLNGLEDLYLARVLSRDPSVGDSQTEWVALAAVLKRAARMAEEGQQRRAGSPPLHVSTCSTWLKPKHKE